MTIKKKTPLTKKLEDRQKVLLTCNTIINAKKVFPKVSEHDLHNIYIQEVEKQLNHVKDSYNKAIKSADFQGNISYDLWDNYYKQEALYKQVYFQLCLEVSCKYA